MLARFCQLSSHRTRPQHTRCFLGDSWDEARAPGVARSDACGCPDARSGRHRLASNICASARAAAPRAAHGLNTHAKSAIGQWMCGPRRRSDEGCVKSLTPHRAASPKSELRHFVGFGRGFLLQMHRRSIFSAHQTARSESNHEAAETRREHRPRI